MSSEVGQHKPNELVHSEGPKHSEPHVGHGGTSYEGADAKAGLVVDPAREANLNRPQLTAVCLSRVSPMLGHSTANFQPLGSTVDMRSPEARALYNTVSPGYFELLGIPLLRGRAFTQQEVDQDAPVAVISEATARRYWPGSDPLGKRISAWKGLGEKRIAGRTFTVIGVVKSVRSVTCPRWIRHTSIFRGRMRMRPCFWSARTFRREPRCL